jgi:glycosyltransferase involved in cell wall biosynthesis
MRVLHLNAGNLYGGVEVLLTTLARQQAVCPEMETQFACSFTRRWSEELCRVGAEPHHLGGVRIRWPWTVWAARRRLRRLLAQDMHDVVVCHGAWGEVVFGPAIRSAGVPLAFWLHDPPGKRLTWLERWAAVTPPDLVLCNSEYTHERAARLYPQVPGSVVYCPVAAPAAAHDAAAREAVRAALGVPPDCTVVVQIGRWEPHKGHKLHLEALARLRHLPNWVCWQVGGTQRPREKTYLEDVMRLAGRLGLAERVRFLGWQEDVPAILASADVYCQPNRRAEPFGITFIEALYAGLPVVATRLGGPPEFIDDTCGILTEPNDVEALANALARLICDSSLRERLGQAGPARARACCAPEVQIPRLCEALARIARCREPAPDCGDIRQPGAVVGSNETPAQQSGTGLSRALEGR